MSQQEFVPRSQDQQSDGQEGRATSAQPLQNDEDEIYQPQYPYHWSGKLNKEGGPRDEPPSSYAEPTMQRGYQAQDYASSAQQNSAANSTSQQWSGNRGQGARRQFGPDGDAFEKGYRPYNSSGQGGQGQWNVPPWARPQPRRRGSMGWLFIIIFLFFMIRPIFALFGLVLAGVGVAIFGIVLPIILILMILSILRLVFRTAFWPGRYRRFRRGPFWW